MQEKCSLQNYIASFQSSWHFMLFNFCHIQMNFTSFSALISRITLKKMPSIRETLQEMGVSVEQVLTELAQKSTDDSNNGTVPTPLTNYLDVRHCDLLCVYI